jgi:hypothetical protein
LGLNIGRHASTSVYRRRKLVLSLDQLAALTSLSRATVASLEKGRWFGPHLLDRLIERGWIFANGLPGIIEFSPHRVQATVCYTTASGLGDFDRVELLPHEVSARALAHRDPFTLLSWISPIFCVRNRAHVGLKTTACSTVYFIGRRVPKSQTSILGVAQEQIAALPDLGVTRQQSSTFCAGTKPLLYAIAF